MSTTKKGRRIIQPENTFTPIQTAELLGDVVKEDNPYRRCWRIIKTARDHHIGTFVKKIEGTGGWWFFTAADVDRIEKVLIRLQAGDPECPYMIRDLVVLLDRPRATLTTQIRRHKLGRNIGGNVCLSEEEKDFLATYNGERGNRMRDYYTLDDPDLLTVTQLAEMLAPNHPALGRESLKSKIRLYVDTYPQLKIGRMHPEKVMWVFSRDDVERMDDALRLGAKKLGLKKVTHPVSVEQTRRQS